MMITTDLRLLSSFLPICVTVVGDSVLHLAFRRGILSGDGEILSGYEFGYFKNNYTNN